MLCEGTFKEMIKLETKMPVMQILTQSIGDSKLKQTWLEGFLGHFWKPVLDLNSHILDVINSAIEEKVIPSIKNAKIQLKTQIWTFGQMDLIRVILVKYALRGTFGQMDCVQKILAKRLMMFRKTSPD